MPFVSQAQRGLFHLAKKNPAVRKRTGITQKAANKMVAHDPGGTLPPKIKATAKAVGRY